MGNYICGIYGSRVTSKFEILDKINRLRGSFASGIFYCNYEERTWDVQKREGSFDWDKIHLPDGYTYLGHNQAPTSSERVWKEYNGHPFLNNCWVVAHNGVLTNFEQLKQSYIPDHPNLVDTSIIPALLAKVSNEKLGEGCDMSAITKEQEVSVISDVINKLHGTFGLWIVNVETLNVYLCRQGSTLFYDENSFSSTKGEGYIPLTEGVIYNFSEKGTIPVGRFSAKTPFLEL